MTAYYRWTLYAIEADSIEQAAVVWDDNGPEVTDGVESVEESAIWYGEPQTMRDVFNELRPSTGFRYNHDDASDALAKHGLDPSARVIPGDRERKPSPTVTVNEEQQLYVIPTGAGHDSLGFDRALDLLDRITTELVGRGAMDERKQRRLMENMRPNRGSLEVYSRLQSERELLRTICAQQGDRAVYSLSPQLNGLEGHLVEVLDKPLGSGGVPRQFIVGRSTGWAPVHLEVKPGEGGGDPARKEYYRVRDLERTSDDRDGIAAERGQRPHFDNEGHDLHG